MQESTKKIQILNSLLLFAFPGLSVKALLNAEMSSRQGQAGYETYKELSEYEISGKQLASIIDIGDSMKQQLLILVEWAKHIPAFIELSLDDQVRASETRLSFGKQLIAILRPG